MIYPLVAVAQFGSLQGKDGIVWREVRLSNDSFDKIKSSREIAAIVKPTMYVEKSEGIQCYYKGGVEGGFDTELYTLQPRNPEGSEYAFKNRIMYMKQSDLETGKLQEAESILPFDVPAIA
ncbi:MAG: hypothetical protein WC069_05850 [Candidatus Shapirobacteria bacterium]